MKFIKIGFKWFCFLVCMGGTTPILAQTPTYPQVRIQSVLQGTLPGPIHHGITVVTEGISDPNLSFYEVQLKPNSSGPYPLWKVYSTQIQPYDGAVINLPYRNGIFAMQANVDYCVRIRSVYGSTVTPWAQQCGIRFPIPTGPNVDTDGDGIPDYREYDLGTDPRNPDSDGDETPDGTEVANGADPDHVLYPNLIIRTRLNNRAIDFGEGDPFGNHPNQHGVLEIENQGDSPAIIRSIRIVDGNVPGSSLSFGLGTYPNRLTQIAPQNILRVPISFIPKKRGRVSAQIEIESNNPTRIPRVVVSGVGVGIPDCTISPSVLDFGTVAVNDQAISKQDITLANKPPEGDTQEPNIDTPWSFTISTITQGIAPGLRVYSLDAEEEITIPVFFQHPQIGNYSGYLEIHSAHCGVQMVEIRGRAE